MASLTEQHREALLLVSWDGLTSEQVSAVLGLRPVAVRRRVSRARVALDRLTDDHRRHPRLSVDTRVSMPATSKELR